MRGGSEQICLAAINWPLRNSLEDIFAGLDPADLPETEDCRQPASAFAVLAVPFCDRQNDRGP